MWDDKQFVNGLIVGAILFAFVIGSAVLYGIRPQSAQPQIPLPRTWANLTPYLPQDQPRAVYAEIDPGVGQSVVIDEKAYTVVVGVSHPSEDELFRLLVRENTAISPDCLQISAKTALFSVWSKQGQSLVRADAAPKTVTAVEGCLEFGEWSERGVALAKTKRGEGEAQQQIWLYDAADGTIMTGEHYQLRSDQQGFHQMWSYKTHTLTQPFSPDTGTYGALSWSEGSISVAYETASAAKANLLDSQNVEDMEKGVHFVINEQPIFIPWTKP